MPVTVTDEKGRFVSNLDAQDFRIFDEGKEQHIHFFSREQKQPVVVGFLVDMSNANRLHWKTYQDATHRDGAESDAGRQEVQRLPDHLRNEAELLVDTTQDAEKLVEKLRKMKPGGGAALYDAIYMACTTRHLVQGEPYEPRRVLIIIGDGHDNGQQEEPGRGARDRAAQPGDHLRA